jgi:asparagine N-glycosylation enzyme membrane subunit Stt3
VLGAADHHLEPFFFFLLFFFASVYIDSLCDTIPQA